MAWQQSHTELLPHLFRQEYARMTAVLCRHFGLKDIEIAEDIASDTFLKASEHWAIHGIPENPTAWLYTVAKNKAKDHFRRSSLFESDIKSHLKSAPSELEEVVAFDEQIIADSQLAMIFAVCNPINSSENQICLALQILCGFSIKEIANAFLSKPEAIKKRLQRARTNLRNDNFKLVPLSERGIASRLSIVLKTLYLLFNEGYFSKTNDNLIRKDLCYEATRLTVLLTEHRSTDTAEANALLALMCFQSSRLDARTNDQGEYVLYDDQDRGLWDKSLIERGNFYLVKATDSKETSKYHLEAAIAYWHTTSDEEGKWKHILRLYNQLILIEYSPVTALNRTFALAKAQGFEKAIAEAEKLNLKENSYYHKLQGFLLSEINMDQAIYHFTQAIRLTSSNPEKQLLIEEIARLEKRKAAAEENG